jgi:uncharacterized protein with HEPN domain
MPSDRDRQWWSDIAENARLALAFAHGMDAEALRSDTKTFYALTRSLEIISEASRRLSEEAKAGADLPWPAISASGNVYRHVYDAVTPERLLKTALEDVPKVLAVAEARLKEG